MNIRLFTGIFLIMLTIIGFIALAWYACWWLGAILTMFFTLVLGVVLIGNE